MRRGWNVVAFAVVASAVACGSPKPAETPHDEESAAVPAMVPVAPSPPPANGGVPYDKDAVEIVLKRAANQVKGNCGAATDEEGKATGPWGKGTVTVKLGHNGHSQGATVSAPFDGHPVGKCIARAFAILIYPPFAGDDASVEWPVEVTAPAAAGH